MATLRAHTKTHIACISCALLLPNGVLAESFQDKHTRQINQQALDAGQRLIDAQTRLAAPSPVGTPLDTYPAVSVPTLDVSGYAALFQAAAQLESEIAAQRELRRALILKRAETDQSPAFRDFMKQHCSQDALNYKLKISGYAVTSVGIMMMLGSMFALISKSKSESSTTQTDVSRSDNRSTVFFSLLGTGAAVGVGGLLIRPAFGKEAYLRADDCR